MIFHFSDEDGFVALVNAETYEGFVHADWELDQLLHHFVAQMNVQNLVIWASNEDGGGEWKIAVLEQPSAKKAFREFSAAVRVTDDCLYLVSYTDLTMAAQFEDEVLPAEPNSELRIPLANGLYQFTVRQMFNPGDYNYEEMMTHFEIVFSLEAGPASKVVDSVFWWVE